MTDGPEPIPVGQEPPPLRPPPPPAGSNGQTRERQGEGKPARRSAGTASPCFAFVDAGHDGVSRVELATWLVLYRDTRNGVACTGMESIAVRVGCSKRGVVNAVERLRRRGLLIQVFRGGVNRRPSRYRVVGIPRPPGSQ